MASGIKMKRVLVKSCNKARRQNEGIQTGGEKHLLVFLMVNGKYLITRQSRRIILSQSTQVTNECLIVILIIVYNSISKHYDWFFQNVIV